MIKIIDTFAQINDLFEDGKFILDKWKAYMNSIWENATGPMFLKNIGIWQYGK